MSSSDPLSGSPQNSYIPPQPNTPPSGKPFLEKVEATMYDFPHGDPLAGTIGGLPSVYRADPPPSLGPSHYDPAGPNVTPVGKDNPKGQSGADYNPSGVPNSPTKKPHSDRTQPDRSKPLRTLVSNKKEPYDPSGVGSPPPNKADGTILGALKAAGLFAARGASGVVGVTLFGFTGLTGLALIVPLCVIAIPLAFIGGAIGAAIEASMTKSNSNTDGLSGGQVGSLVVASPILLAELLAEGPKFLMLHTLGMAGAVCLAFAGSGKTDQSERERLSNKRDAILNNNFAQGALTEKDVAEKKKEPVKTKKDEYFSQLEAICTPIIKNYKDTEEAELRNSK